MSDVLKQDECEWVDDLRETENVTLFPRWRTGLLSTIERLVEEVERLRLVRVAAVNHLLRTDIGFREKRAHTPACRPGSGGNENYCSTCALQKAIEESHT